MSHTHNRALDQLRAGDLDGLQVTLAEWDRGYAMANRQRAALEHDLADTIRELRNVRAELITERRDRLLDEVTHRSQLDALQSQMSEAAAERQRELAELVAETAALRAKGRD